MDNCSSNQPVLPCSCIVSTMLLNPLFEVGRSFGDKWVSGQTCRADLTQLHAVYLSCWYQFVLIWALWFTSVPVPKPLPWGSYTISALLSFWLPPPPVLVPQIKGGIIVVHKVLFLPAQNDTGEWFFCTDWLGTFSQVLPAQACQLCYPRLLACSPT